MKQRIRHGLPPETALEYVITLSSCLTTAHAVQIVHRDIKPVNILFRHDGTLLLNDFGVAIHLTTIEELTATGNMVGSPH
ncbi:protein kinase domain-containing protein, partial [Salmonella sp. SAL4448]|uniref:protein kinase domain-containing protein n=1 Tax=Salmonella sp. SAL4448 TaxID=3159903 RepID=UPI003979AB55